ncbi:hypothetical protein [Glycomyces buryatensis]|uniref:WXG100 family type VII secretion target n=1 Tax=Glycomyces buryatensis TaxID=2570927 RepID=A0A4S8QM42_9ACTN|nr:hypothetical protein [Glycomyces buryatensis]THV42479.1 hypothetical protein FAB82_06290 [Glycomyces buryatensis]
MDLSKAPRHTDFGEATGIKGDTAGSYDGSREAAYKKLPIISNLISIDDNRKASNERFAKLFDGKATLDDALAQVQAVLGLQTDINLLVDASFAAYEGATSKLPPAAFIGSSLAGAGLDFMTGYFQPLQDALNVFTGNEERIAVSGLMWDSTGKALIEVGEEIGKLTNQQLVPAWEGEACAGAEKRLGEFQNVIEVCAQLSSGVSTLMALTADFAKRLFGRARQMMIDTVNNVIACAEALLNPVTAVGAVVTACLQINRALLEVLQMAIQAARIYLQAAQLMIEINRIFDKTVRYLEWAAADPIPSGKCEGDIRV